MLDLIDILTFNKKPKDESFFMLFGDIDDSMAQQTVEWVINANYSEDPPEILTMFISSSGGDLNCAWAIIDVIRGSTIPIRIIGLGQIASAGLLIFISGEKGMRILSENTSVMSHQYFWGSQGKHHELLAQVKEMNLIQERLIRHFKKTTGMTDKVINDKLMPAHDVYLSASEAKKLGICDEVKSLK